MYYYVLAHYGKLKEVLTHWSLRFVQYGKHGLACFAADQVEISECFAVKNHHGSWWDVNFGATDFSLHIYGVDIDDLKME